MYKTCRDTIIIHKNQIIPDSCVCERRSVAGRSAVTGTFPDSPKIAFCIHLDTPHKRQTGIYTDKCLTAARSAIYNYADRTS